jgi:hypothetical protein
MDIVMHIVDDYIDDVLLEVFDPDTRHLNSADALQDWLSLLLTCKTFHRLGTQSRFPISRGLLPPQAVTNLFVAADPVTGLPVHIFWRGEASDLPARYRDSDVEITSPPTQDLSSIFHYWQLTMLAISHGLPPPQVRYPNLDMWGFERYGVLPEFHRNQGSFGNFHLNPRFDEHKLSGLMREYGPESAALLFFALPIHFFIPDKLRPDRGVRPFFSESYDERQEAFYYARENLVEDGFHVGLPVNRCVVGDRVSRVSFNEWTFTGMDSHGVGLGKVISSKDITVDPSVEWWVWDFISGKRKGGFFGISKEGHRWYFDPWSLYTNFNKRGRAARKINKKFGQPLKWGRRMDVRHRNDGYWI